MRVVALSVDPPATNADVVRRNHLPLPLLSDATRETVAAYGLRHRAAGPGGSDIAVPAHVLVARDGRILWRYVSPRVQERQTPAEVLAAVRQAFAGAGSNPP